MPTETNQARKVFLHVVVNYDIRYLVFFLEPPCLKGKGAPVETSDLCMRGLRVQVSRQSNAESWTTLSVPLGQPSSVHILPAFHGRMSPTIVTCNHAEAAITLVYVYTSRAIVTTTMHLQGD